MHIGAMHENEETENIYVTNVILKCRTTWDWRYTLEKPRETRRKLQDSVSEIIHSSLEEPVSEIIHSCSEDSVSGILHRCFGTATSN